MALEPGLCRTTEDITNRNNTASNCGGLELQETVIFVGGLVALYIGNSNS